MRTWRTLRWLSVALAVSACAENANHLQTVYLDHFATLNPTLSEFTVCRGFYCTERLHATISKDQWRRVTAVFKPRAKNARHSGSKSRGVALIEPLLDRKPEQTPAMDASEHVRHPNAGDLTQLDCGTSINIGPTRRHGAQRTPPFTGSSRAPAQHAVLQEINGDRFAIDASLSNVGCAPDNAARDLVSACADPAIERGSSGCDRGPAPS